MEINLRKARKLEQKIQVHVDKIEFALEVEVRTLGEKQEREAQVAAARENLLTEETKRRNLLKVRFEIRRLISSANEALKLNDLMNRREEIQAILKLDFSGAEVQDEIQMQDLAEVRRRQIEKGENSYGGVNVRVAVLTTDDVIRIKRDAGELKRELEEIEDQMSQKNLGARIRLGDEMVALLQSEDLL